MIKMFNKKVVESIIETEGNKFGNGTDETPDKLLYLHYNEDEAIEEEISEIFALEGVLKVIITEECDETNLITNYYIPYQKINDISITQ